MILEALCIFGEKLNDADIVLLVFGGLAEEYSSLIQNVS